jgi:PAS domain S-box-containing protein
MWEDVLMGKNWQGTLVNKRKNGDFYYEEMTIVPVFNELNIITNYVAIKRDVTAVKKSQEEILKSETKYRQIFENATEGIIMLNYETILFANPAFEQLTGYSNFQVNNRKFIDMIFDADKETVFKLTHTKDKNFLHQKHDVRLVDTNNNIKWVNINANKVNWDNKIMILLFISNITGRKKAEEALEEERTFLAERVIERTEELSALNAELSKAVRAKDEFLANMSHELRTPLNAILGLSEILQYQLQGNINEKQQKSFKTINESGQHLLSLINDILDLSKIEAGKLDLLKENVLIDPICVSSLRFISETANKKSIKVHYDHSDKNLQVWADTRRLRQILINLLSNAVKFTPAGKEIGLTVTPSQDKHTILFEVWDNGIGIPERDMKSLFKPFVQLDSALSREFEGSGLGLSLVAKMVELHGGSIEVQSQLGEGSRFIVAMPSKNPDIIEYEEDLDYDISCMQDRTVIVITESQSDYNVISNVLHERTAHIYRFDDDSKGINDVMEIQPHLIIIDSTIKHRSAWEIMAILKNDFRTKDIKIIMASMGKELEKASVVGADAFIGKPITANKVRKALCETYGVQFMDAFQNDKDKQFTILLAEDNEANIETIEAFLTMNKYKIIVARNGQEAIEWVHEHRPDLILMDIQMPKMNGFEAIEFLKTSDEFRDIPIIALTALAMPGDRKKILDAGANDYLSKPISMIVLIERIQSYLKSR